MPLQRYLAYAQRVVIGAQMEAAEKPDFAAIAKTTHFSKSELRRMYRRFLSIADAETNTVSKEMFLTQPEVCHCCIMPLAVDHAIRSSAAGEEWLQQRRHSAMSTLASIPAPDPHIPLAHPRPAPVASFQPSEQSVHLSTTNASSGITGLQQDFDVSGAGIGLSFVEYVQVLSKFSVKATLAEKNDYLFSILDRDCDEHLQADDLYHYYCSMLGQRYTPAALKELTKRVWRTICPHGEKLLARRDFFGKCLNATELQFAMTIHY